MTSAMPTVDRNEERRRRLLLGPLPPTFLRTTTGDHTVENDYQIAVAMEHQQMYGNTVQMHVPETGRLSVTIVQAKLVKNYGLTRMDPYVRLRVGHCIFETHTDPSGGKTPRWNKVIHCLLPAGVTSMYLEIYDECSFTMDELIAWAHITIPTPVLNNGETQEDWYPLNGKQGDGMEGMINLVLSYSVGAPPMARYPQVVVVPHTGAGYATLPMYPHAPVHHVPATLSGDGSIPHPPPAPGHNLITPEQLKQIEEMFPSMDKEVIKSVAEANRGNKDATINSLLQMSE